MRSGFGVVGLDFGASKFRCWEGWWCAMLKGWRKRRRWKLESEKNFGFVLLEREKKREIV